MAMSTKFTPPNSLFLVMDSHAGEIPASMDGLAHEFNFGQEPVFEASLATPSRRIVVKSVLGMNVIGIATPKPEAVVKIWMNDADEPDKIVIGIV